MSAKVTFAIDDRSTNVTSISGIAVGMVAQMDRGEPFKPKFITNPDQLKRFAGDASPVLGSTLYAAKRYLTQGNQLWLTRAISDDSLTSAVLVRSKTIPVPTTPVSSINSECLTVKGLDGLKWNDIPSYQFPLYLGNREYIDPGVLVTEDSSQDKLYVNDITAFSEGDKVSAILNPDLDVLNDPDDTAGEVVPFSTIKEVVDTEVAKEIIILNTVLTVAAGTEIKYLDESDSEVSYVPAVIVQEDAVSANTLVVNNSDLIHMDHDIVISASQYTLVSKDIINVPVKYLLLESPLVASKNDSVLIIDKYEYEERDSLLIHTTPGTFGNRISVGIEDHDIYEDAFWVVEYLDGVEQTRYACTKDYRTDGFNNQMFVEDVINGVSQYITVVNNPANPDKPKPTQYSVWIRDPEDIFQAVPGATVAEDFLAGHTEIHLSSVAGLVAGTRIKIFTAADNVLGEEYKIVSVSGTSIIIDRKATQSRYLEDSPVIYKFASDLTDPAQGITNGVKRFVPAILDKAYPGYKINRPLNIGPLAGKLVDAGANFTTGGTKGSPVTIGNMIVALNTLSSRGSTPISIVDDGGIADPAYAQAVANVVRSQKYCHGYINSPGRLEDYIDAPQRIVEYRRSLGLDDRIVSLFSGWIKVFDEINQVYVWEAPSTYAVCAQSYVTRERTIFTPAAGLINGMVSGLDVRYKFTEGERDLLVANQINPMKYDNGRIAIWGNETLQSRPSPLQLRSVNFLLISLQVQMESLNEYKLFDFNNESTWVPLEGALDALLRDEYLAKGGVYAFDVAIQDVVTDTDINMRRMPIFVGLQPTLDIQKIPTTIAIYSKGAEIEVRV